MQTTGRILRSLPLDRQYTLPLKRAGDILCSPPKTEIVASAECVRANVRTIPELILLGFRCQFPYCGILSPPSAARLNCYVRHAPQRHDKQGEYKHGIGHNAFRLYTQFALSVRVNAHPFLVHPPISSPVHPILFCRSCAAFRWHSAPESSCGYPIVMELPAASNALMREPRLFVTGRNLVSITL